MLPPGAAPPTTPHYVELMNTPVASSPPSTPHQRLLDESDDQHVQFASYPERTSQVTLKNIAPAKTWTPLPLRPYVYLPYALFLILLAVALEVAFHTSQKNSGFKVHGNADALGRQSGVWHYVYTLPPVAFAMFVVGMWAWTDIEIKKLQPYVDLVQGDSPPHRSLLLDYTRHHTLLVWWPALSNKHYTVLLASLLAIVSLAFQPLAAALLDVRDIYWSLPVMTTAPNTLLSLAPGLSAPSDSGIPDTNSPLGDMTAFLSASGFAAASALYPDLPNPPFVTIDPVSNDGWTVMDVAFPKSLPRNGTTVAMNVTALRTSPNCRRVPVSMTQLADGNWTNVVKDEATNCGLTWNVNHTGPNLFGADVGLCGNETILAPTEFNSAGKWETNPVFFWFFTYAPPARASATVCKPTIELFDVTATLSLVPNSNVEADVQSSLTKVVIRNSFDATRSPAYTQFAGNLSASGVNSSTNSIAAFNGLGWDQAFTSNATAIHDRLDGPRLVMPAAIWQVATMGGGSAGVEGAFGSDRFVELSNRVYTSYLSLLAKSLYFVPYRQGQAQDESVDLFVTTTVKRLFLSPFSTHILTVLLIILALLSLFIHLSHTHNRRNLRLRHLPGTIASAVSIGGQTSDLLSEKEAGRGRGMTDEELKDALRYKRFRIDPSTMKIVMEGEEGFLSATSPSYRQGEFKWIPETVERIKRGSRRVSGFYGGKRESRVIDIYGSPGSSSPRSARTPRTPRSAGSGLVPRSGEA
ncbi:hypothetical protein PQX77_010500 [Marasmius sp. AFHP31]|nr:hypothetical protein PQX77_010500 [Marasmius sp. AFHP31]